MLCKDFNVQVCISFPTKTWHKIPQCNNVWFQITGLVRFGSVWFWFVTVLLSGLGSLLLCPFHHKKLRI